MGEERLGLVPVDYTGLSYESAQLYNPAYFSEANTSLVRAFRKLSSHGVLRLGGNLSDVTRWKGRSEDFSTPRQVAGIEYGKTYWEWKLTDPSVQSEQRWRHHAGSDSKPGPFSPCHELETDLRLELRVRFSAARC